MQQNPRSLDEVLNRLKNFNSGNATTTDNQTKPQPKPSKGDISRLREAFEKFQTPITLKPGDIVRGKPGLAENFNDWDQPHIIMEKFAEPRQVIPSAREASMNCAAYVYHGVMAKVNDGQVHMYLCDFRLWEVIPESELKGN